MVVPTNYYTGGKLGLSAKTYLKELIYKPAADYLIVYFDKIDIDYYILLKTFLQYVSKNNCLSLFGMYRIIKPHEHPKYLLYHKITKFSVNINNINCVLEPHYPDNLEKDIIDIRGCSYEEYLYCDYGYGPCVNLDPNNTIINKCKNESASTLTYMNRVYIERN